MALVRCPKHKIPYNDENPRGCPACAREKQGRDQMEVMRELARATQGSVRRPEEESSEGAEGTGTTTRPPPRQTLAELFAGQPPRQAPTPPQPESLFERVRRSILDNRVLKFGLPLVALLGLFLILTGGRDFVERVSPPPFAGEPLPLPVDPGMRVETVFATLGTQVALTHPASPRLARYSYGEGLNIDAYNRVVYSVAFELPNRIWRGLRVGVPEAQAAGALAFLGRPAEAEREGPSSPRLVDGYLTYPSLDERPVRRLRAEVRPPNGCYDVIVELRPRAIGELIQGDSRLAVVGRQGAEQQWVSTLIRAVSRMLPGPYSGPPVC